MMLQPFAANFERCVIKCIHTYRMLASTSEQNFKIQNLNFQFSCNPNYFTQIIFKLKF